MRWWEGLAKDGETSDGLPFKTRQQCARAQQCLRVLGRSATVDVGAGAVAVLGKRGLQLPCFFCFAFFATVPVCPHAGLDTVGR